MNVRNLVLFTILGMGMGAGCDDVGAVDAADADLGAVLPRPGSGASGGVWLNTSTIGTTAFSELDLSGQVHAGAQFTGAQLLRPGNVWLDITNGSVKDGTLEAKVGSKVYKGADLIGSRWQLTLFNADTDGDGDHDADDEAAVPVEIWITAVQQISTKEARYVFETYDADDNVVPVCSPDASGATTMVPIKDLAVDEVTGKMTKRSNTLYLACTSGAIGKAVTWGYRPWERTLEEFEVATRMIRADYCFTGHSFTQTGTSMQVKDRYNINTFLHTGDPNEAVWGRTGVRCINTPRSSTYSAPQVQCNGQTLPACPSDVSLTTYSDALFWTKVDAG
ncbi:ADYC domain-containing protein [Nannocystis bainbridge]|uniref:ADYC domain-containing protein n=1 Tax=Nannocystis bainbridge TaxID=2995303 RepID=A0ABT5E0J9_9BACT|nr:ADYC domain-containing protein [Nannocystis bainbridge]MDC0718940.1 ADYC domain-containing protein [Nannocystis bainbridge]